MTFRIETETIDLPFPAQQIGWQSFDVDNNDNWLAIRKTTAGLKLVSPWNEVHLPLNLDSAMVRCLDDKALVVFPRIKAEGETNAWIVDPNTGHVVKGFSVGDGVEDVMVLDDYVVVSYFDQGILGKTRPSKEGIAIFDPVGNYLWGYASGVKNPVDLIDCYAMCPAGGGRLAFCGYKDFALVELDLAKQTQVITPTPTGLHGCSAMACLKDIIFFRGPYPSDSEGQAPRDAVFAFDKRRGQVSAIGDLAGDYVRGLSDGRMLSISGGSVVIARFTDLEH